MSGLCSDVGQQRLDRGLRLGLVAAPEQIGVVELVIQVVEPLTTLVAGRSGPGGVVAGEERGREAPEQCCHRQIHLPIGLVHGRIEEGTTAIGQQATIA